MQESGTDEMEDIRLLPVLLVTSNVDPGTQLAADYRLAVKPTVPTGNYDIMVPLSPVGAGGDIRALSRQGGIQCSDRAQHYLDWREAGMAGSGHDGDAAASTTILAQYEDTFRLTGFSVGKSDDYEFAIFHTPTSPTELYELVKLRIGLDGVFGSQERVQESSIGCLRRRSSAPSRGDSISVTSRPTLFLFWCRSSVHRVSAGSTSAL